MKLDILSDGTMEGTSVTAGNKSYAVESVMRSGDANNPNSIRVVVDTGVSESVADVEERAAAAATKAAKKK